MNKIIIILVFLCQLKISSNCQSINCNLYKLDKKYFKACKLFTKACQKKQGSERSQKILDKIIKKCPNFSHAYYVKAIPYLKRGIFIEWKELIDKAVFYNPEEYLGYRGGCRFQFLRDYIGAINDIERLILISNNDIGYIYNGDYHLKTILALSYSAINENNKALTILNSHLSSFKYTPAPYDYLHLGILQLNCNDIKSAIESFNLQIEINDFVAETYYYMGIAYSKLGKSNLSLLNFKNAKIYYLNGNKLPGRGFVNYYHKIYMRDINAAILSHL